MKTIDLLYLRIVALPVCYISEEKDNSHFLIFIISTKQIGGRDLRGNMKTATRQSTNESVATTDQAEAENFEADAGTVGA